MSNAHSTNPSAADDIVTFPGFPGTPTHDRFPLYGYAPYGKSQWAVTGDIRVRHTDGYTVCGGDLDEIVIKFNTLKEVQSYVGALNLTVWEMIR